MAQASLRRRLVALLVGVTAAAWLAVAASAYFEARHEAEELLDAHLAQSAALLVAQGGELHEIDTEHAPLLHRYARKTAFQVWLRGRTLGLHSANAPDERLSPVEEGFSDAVHAGEPWRVFSTWDAERKALVQVAERRSARESIARALASALLWPLAGALPLLGGAIWFGVGHGLRPLAALRGQIERRRAADLQPLEAARAPAEVAPLVDGLNRLFARIAQAMERERRLTADAAHELRTPLAVLSTQAQLARRAPNDAARDEALDALVAGAESTARLAEQMLTLARLESGETGGARELVDVREIVRAAMADMAAPALAKKLELALEEGPAVRIEGYRGLLAILVRNLLDNAVRYTQPGDHVQAAVRALREGGASIELADDGPGVAPEALASLGERFHRGAERGESGSGLGLSIVQRIAELHRGSVRFALGPSGRGLAVTVELRSSAAPG